MRQFANRREAGKELARKLSNYKGRADVIVLALPRGGVPAARTTAAAVRMIVCVCRSMAIMPGIMNQRSFKSGLYKI